MDVYASIPLLPYPGLKLSLWRPGFTEKLLEFDPHVNPPRQSRSYLRCIFMLVQKQERPSYHTNLDTYCTQYGYSYCAYTACPFVSTRHILSTKRSIEDKGGDAEEIGTIPFVVILYVKKGVYTKRIRASADKLQANKSHPYAMALHLTLFKKIVVDVDRLLSPLQGYLQGGDLATTYVSADIFTFSSCTETFGEVVLEDVASDLPVVGL
ncbi:hypothetical protein BD408DRAFT_443566 [Parasitella parasitica]|nr:hypothetical protein BD408DRAFT_443566 [Parasitella parasitica]